MFIQLQFVEDAGEVDALEHQDIPHNFRCQESVLHFLIGDEVIKPILTKTRNSTELEKVG
jgi:hypothetical protein